MRQSLWIKPIKGSLAANGNTDLRSINLKNSKNKVNYIFYSLLIFADFLFYLIAHCFKQSKNAAWISVIVTALISIIILVVLNFFIKNSCKINSNALNKTYLILLAIFSYIKSSLYLATASESISTYFYRQSPADFILLLLCVGCFFCLLTEKRALIITGGIVATLAMFLLVLMTITASPDFKIERIYPILGNGNYKSFISLPFILSIGNVLFFYRDNGGKKPVMPILYAGVTGAVLLLGISLVMPYSLLGESFPNPVYQLSSLASLGLLFKKFEIVLLGLWVLCALAVGGYFSYTALDCVKTALAFNDKKGIAGMHIIAVYSFGALFLKLGTEKMYSYASILFFVFALLCLAITIIKTIKISKGGKSEAKRS